jgi:hypothetical protein
MIDLESTAGFKITNSKIQVVELSLKSGSIYVKDIIEVFFNEKIDLYKDKETKISALLQSAFNEILLQNPINDKYISFSIPQNLFYSTQLVYEQSLLYTELIEDFRWQLSLVYPFLNVNEVDIQYFPIRKNEFIKNNQAYVTALPRSISSIFSKFCENNNLHLRFIDSTHTASDKALLSGSDISATRVLLSLMIEENFLSFIFYTNGEPFLFRTLAYNGAHDIPGLVVDEIEKNNLQGLIDNGFVSGDELSPSFITRLSEKINISFKQFNPFSKLQLDPAILENKFYLLKNNSFSPAVGISIRSL